MTPMPGPDRFAGTAGPTAIKIAAGIVTDEESRAGLVGTWEPDADLGLPPGSNHIVYLEDGIYINPFRNVALIGFWSATADSLTMTPTEIRDIETAAPTPDLKDVFAQIRWNTAGSTRIAWLTPGRFKEEGAQEPRRRAERVHDLERLHAAVASDLLVGSWTSSRGETVFMQDGTYRETTSSLPGRARQSTVTGRYRVEGEAGALVREVQAVENGGPDAPRAGTRAVSRLQWLSRDELTWNGEQWRRR
jgi:hypothetical protein